MIQIIEYYTYLLFGFKLFVSNTIFDNINIILHVKYDGLRSLKFRLNKIRFRLISAPNIILGQYVT